MDNRQPVRRDQYDSTKKVTENKILDIPKGCERVAIQFTTPNHYCQNSTHFVGSVEVSFRHLRKLGYRLVIVRILSVRSFFLPSIVFRFLIMNYPHSIHRLHDIVIYIRSYFEIINRKFVVLIVFYRCCLFVSNKRKEAKSQKENIFFSNHSSVAESSNIYVVKGRFNSSTSYLRLVFSTSCVVRNLRVNHRHRPIVDRKSLVNLRLKIICYRLDWLINRNINTSVDW